MNVINVNEVGKRKFEPLETAEGSLKARIAAVVEIAKIHADSVDREARFPAEAIAAAKQNRLLGVQVPKEFGGESASIHDVMDMCFALGRACSATAMIIAMHHVKVACIVRHAAKNAWVEEMMSEIADKQLLMGSSTTEGVQGGNVRSSAAAAEVVDGKFSLLRDASVISYGAECDGIVTTARRAIDAVSSDQVLVILRKQDYELEITQGWDVLGMRGTRSTGFKLKAEGVADQVMPESYDKIHAQSMVPFAHLLWGSAWTGIAASAVDKSQAFIRKVARAANGQLPPGAVHFGKAKASLNRARALLSQMGDYFHRIKDDKATLASLEFQSAIASLKIEVSDLAVETVLSALRSNGLGGYRNDGEFSVSRELRDVLSSPLMIHNDRIAANMATANLMAAVPTSLRS